MLRSRLCDYSNAYELARWTIAVAPEISAALNNANRKVIFKNKALFTNCISRINNTQVDDGNDIDRIIEYSDNC